MPASSRPWSDVTRLVIDNGGHTCKVGFAGEEKPTKCMFNGLAKSKSEHKVFVGDQLESCQDFSALQYRLSLERGCLVNWDTQAEVWARAFGPEVLKVNPADCSLLVSECPMCPNAIQDTLDEMLFEHFGFHSYCSRPAPALAALAIAHQQASEPRRPAALVVDSGFSSTHTMPIFGGTPVNFATRRLNVGGKLLTNQLKTIVSYRSYNVMEENYLINDVKERLCYLSLDLQSELALTRFKGKKNTLRRDFIMPDYVNHFRGQIRDPNEPAPPNGADASAAAAGGKDSTAPPPKKKANVAKGKEEPEEQVLKLANERISVPELLFNPSDIGMEQAGLAECIVQSAEACTPDLREALYANIVLTGGSIQFPNFEERLKQELRALVPGEVEIDVTRAADPIVAAWKGGSIFASSEAYPSQAVTREQYKEGGHAYCRRKFFAQSIFD
jgi:actin-related protein 6